MRRTAAKLEMKDAILPGPALALRVQAHLLTELELETCDGCTGLRMLQLRNAPLIFPLLKGAESLPERKTTEGCGHKKRMTLHQHGSKRRTRSTFPPCTYSFRFAAEFVPLATNS